MSERENESWEVRRVGGAYEAQWKRWSIVLGATLAMVVMVYLAACTPPKVPEVTNVEEARQVTGASLAGVAKAASGLFQAGQAAGVDIITLEQFIEIRDEIKRGRALLVLVPPDLAGARGILTDQRKLLIFILQNLPEE